jgi:hypothetical protein
VHPDKKSDMKTRILALAAAFAVAAALGQVNAAKGDALPPNWHVHDCTTGPCVPPHAPTAFFPYILGQTPSQYLADPATCPTPPTRLRQPQEQTAWTPPSPASQMAVRWST